MQREGVKNVICVPPLIREPTVAARPEVVGEHDLLICGGAGGFPANSRTRMVLPACLCAASACAWRAAGARGAVASDSRSPILASRSFHLLPIFTNPAQM